MKLTERKKLICYSFVISNCILSPQQWIRLPHQPFYWISNCCHRSWYNLG